MSPARWGAGLLLISAALLAYELLLMRLLALAYWGHFAGLVISIAMLGIGCSGLFLFFGRDRVKARPGQCFAVCAGMFGIAAPLVFLLSQTLPFTPFLLTWSAQEYGLLAARSLLFFLPFFAGGIAIGVPFVAGVLPMGRLYFWNMLGSGLPALPLLFAMNFAHPLRLLIGVSALAMTASALFARSLLVRLGWLLAAGGVIVAVALAPFRYSEYKDLPKTLLLPDARLIEERYGWDGVVQIVDSPHTRYVPGLSLNFTGTLPSSRLVFTDAGAMTLAFAPAETLSNSGFLRSTPEAFSFALTTAPSVLHFYGGSADLLRARAFGARQVRLIDDSSARVAALRSLLISAGPLPDGSDFSGALIRADPRQILERRSADFDVIGISLLGTHGTSAAGAASLDPSFLLTMEGFARIFQRLAPRGHAVISTWVENPPRSGLRLAALCIATLREAGIEHPSEHLLAIRSWATLSIFVGRDPFEAHEINALKSFCDENSFDLVWFDGIAAAEANKINVLPEDPYYEAFSALLGPKRVKFIAQSPFALDPPRDDRPFFNQYFRWAAVPQWVATMGMAWLPFVEWGYILHVATFVVVTILGILLLIVPCMATRARPSARTAFLFFLLGVAYMFVQIWAILKLSQFLGHSLLASALALFAMLTASGAGAAFLAGSGDKRSSRNLVLLCAALGCAIALFPVLLTLFLSQPAFLRVGVAILWLVVPAFFMGFPFPYSLACLARDSDVPWALALNGLGSVLGASLATLVAVHFGSLALAGAALGAYGVAALLVPAGSSRAGA